MPRDVQRSRVYEAEQVAARAVGMQAHGRTIPNAEVQPWIDAAMAKRAVHNRWPGQKIKYVEKRGGNAYGGYGKVSLPLFARNEWVILHEIAHCLTYGKGDIASHGPEFAGVFLFLVETVIGKDAGAALRAAYREQRVRSNREMIPAPMDATEARLRRERDEARHAVWVARQAYTAADAAYTEYRRQRREQVA